MGRRTHQARAMTFVGTLDWNRNMELKMTCTGKNEIFYGGRQHLILHLPNWETNLLTLLVFSLAERLGLIGGLAPPKEKVKFNKFEAYHLQ